MDIRAQSNMPLQLFQSWEHNDQSIEYQNKGLIETQPWEQQKRINQQKKNNLLRTDSSLRHGQGG